MDSEHRHSSSARRFGFTEKVAHAALGRREAKYMAYATILLGGSERDNHDLEHCWQAALNGRGVTNGIKHFFKMLCRELDSRLDTMTPEQVVALGDTHVSTHPCEFLNNFLSKKDWKVMEEIVHDGLLNRDSLTIILNHFADMHVEQAQAAISLRDDPTNPALRDIISTMHLRSNELCAILLTNSYRQHELDPATATEYATLAKEHGRAVRLGRIIEYHDDVLDFFKDYHDECRTGSPNPNTVITEYMRLIHDKPPEVRNEHLRKLGDFVEHAMHSRKRVMLADMPPELRLAMYEVVRKSEHEAEPLRQGSMRNHIAYDMSIDLVGAQIKKGWLPGESADNDIALSRR